jgi:hypothetical protein
VFAEETSGLIANLVLPKGDEMNKEPNSRAPVDCRIRVQFWLAELDRYGNPTLIDGAHSERGGAEEALTLRKRLPMLNTEGRRFAIAEVRLSEPSGEHGPLNEEALQALGAGAP